MLGPALTPFRDTDIDVRELVRGSIADNSPVSGALDGRISTAPAQRAPWQPR